MDGPIRKILHIDMDAFYASVEQRDDPALRGRPVAVGHGAARGVVAAASYEARAFGVRSAMASVTALERCPHLVFVKPRFDAYRAVSRQIHAIFADYTDLIEPLSLDEAYLDVTADRRGLGSAWTTAKEIRARIQAETALTASAGVSYNKFLAKLASDHRKPNGQFAVTPDKGESFVETLPVGRFHGVGPVTAARMAEMARPAPGTTRSPGRGTSGRCARIASANRPARRPPSPPIASNRPPSKRGSWRWPPMSGPGARAPARERAR
jgi:DNA polymerase-4